MKILYRFEFDDRPDEEFTVCFDHAFAASCEISAEPPPDWTRLSFHQCPHCPLEEAACPHCPLATNVADIIYRFEGMVSHDNATTRVTTNERTYTHCTSVQRGLSSLLGLLIATSNCPHTAFLRPMARFHLPFSSEEETIFRVAGSYLIGQHLRQAAGLIETVSFDGLGELYANMEVVNSNIHKRIVAATSQDASVNAIVILDCFAKAIPYVIEDKLEEIRPIYAAYLDRETI